MQGVNDEESPPLAGEDVEARGCEAPERHRPGRCTVVEVEGPAQDCRHEEGRPPGPATAAHQGDEHGPEPDLFDGAAKRAGQQLQRDFCRRGSCGVGELPGAWRQEVRQQEAGVQYEEPAQPGQGFPSPVGYGTRASGNVGDPEGVKDEQTPQQDIEGLGELMPGVGQKGGEPSCMAAVELRRAWAAPWKSHDVHDGAHDADAPVESVEGGCSPAQGECWSGLPWRRVQPWGIGLGLGP